jgi:site-specific recombinase XerD
MQTNRSTFNTLFYFNRGKAKKSGKCPIFGRISIDDESTAFSTGLDILPSEWNADKGKATGKSKETQSVNKRIEQYESEILSHYNNMLENKGFVSAEMLKNALRGIGINQNTVVREFADYLESKRKSIGVKIREQSYKLYCNGFQCFKQFLSDKFSLNDIPFGQLNIALIEDYTYYMKVERQMKPCTVITFLKPLSSTVKRALNKGLILQNPFLDYVPAKAANKIKYLSYSEIEKLSKVEMPSHPKWIFTRNMFLFSVFTGISNIDIKNLKFSDISLKDDGSVWIELNRQKTGTTSFIPLLDFPQRIIEKYQNTRFSGTDGKIFRLATLPAINNQLKILAQAAGIEKNLTFHMGRHSFATSICLTNGVPIESVSRMMGHKSIKTTQIYAKVTRTKLNEDMTRLEKKIEGKYRLAV